jgi:hypothetical protein
MYKAVQAYIMYWEWWLVMLEVIRGFVKAIRRLHCIRNRCRENPVYP